MQVFRVKDAIIHVKDIEVKGFCTGIDYFQGRWILGYWKTPPRVEMVSKEGDIMHTLTTNSSGDYLFEEPDYIYVDTTTDIPQVLVSDWGTKKVYILNIELQLLQAFTLPSPGEPRGLSAVGEGQVLVADAGNDTLQLLDLTTGRWRAVLGWEEFQLVPHSLAYNPATKCLFVGGISNEVRMFTLSK